MSYGRVENSTGRGSQAVFLIGIELILDVGLQFHWLIRSQRVGESYVRTDFDVIRETIDHARNINLKASLAVRFEVTDKVKLDIGFLLCHHVRGRNIEER